MRRMKTDEEEAGTGSRGMVIFDVSVVRERVRALDLCVLHHVEDVPRSAVARKSFTHACVLTWRNKWKGMRRGPRDVRSGKAAGNLPVRG
jgi:hypothetical protein